MKILHLDSSMNGQQSVSRHVSQAIVEALIAKCSNEDHEVVYRDLDANRLQYLTIEEMSLIRNGVESTTPLSSVLLNKIAQIESVIEEFLSCDALVIGAPMYNHTIPATLHVWIDWICQPGKTFKYTQKGPQGLVSQKPIYVASSRGGFYSTPEMIKYDQQEVYLTSIFELLGLNQVIIFRAEGTGIPELKQQALINVEKDIQAHFYSAT